MKFEKVKLNDIAEVTMGQSPKSEFYSDYDGMPFLQGTRTFGRLYPEIDTYTTKITKIADENDILFSVRAPVGDINFAPTKLCIGRGLASIKPKEVNEQYLYYLLIGNIKMYESKSTGTIFSSINKKELENLEFEIPDLEEQQKIGRFLWSVDQKIELNNSIIANLEELAQTLFKHWFVDFEFPNEEGKPYKSSGGKMVESELGMIPEGWVVTDLNSVMKQVGEGIKVNDLQDSPYIGLADMPQSSIALDSWSSSEGVSSNKTTFSKGDILFGKLRPYFKKVGIAPIDGVCSTDVLVLNSLERQYYSYLLCILTSDLFIGYCTATSTGTRMPRTGWRQMSTFKIVKPISEVVFDFNSIIEGMFNVILDKVHENISLSNLRDTLLPKLLSGEIELPDDMEVTDDVPIS